MIILRWSFLARHNIIIKHWFLGEYRTSAYCFLEKLQFRCCNPSLGLMTEVRACKGAGQVWRPGVTSHALENVGKFEGMNPHTPKWAPILEVGVPMEFWIFKNQLQGSKPSGFKHSLYHWKYLELRCLKWPCMTHLDTSNISYGQKKGRESNYQIWLPTTKSQESPQFPCVQVMWDIPIEISQ
jgi:hypothetical protein